MKRRTCSALNNSSLPVRRRIWHDPEVISTGWLLCPMRTKLLLPVIYSAGTSHRCYLPAFKRSVCWNRAQEIQAVKCRWHLRPGEGWWWEERHATACGLRKRLFVCACSEALLLRKGSGGRDVNRKAGRRENKVEVGRCAQLAAGNRRYWWEISGGYRI